MDLSGVIFVVLALVWAAYLLPKALRHHDEVARTRSVEEVSEHARVVVSAPSDTRRPGRVRRVRTAAAERTAALTPAGRAARRRRRILAVLVAVGAVTAVAAAAAVVPVWAVLVPLGLLLGFLVLRGDLGRRDRARRGAVRPTQAAAAPRTAQPVEQLVQQPVEQPVEQLVTVAAPAATAPVGSLDDTGASRELVVGVPTQRSSGSSAVAPAAAGSLWDPLPVTLPTYVGKQRAMRSVRTISLGDPGVSSSGRDAADSALVAGATTSGCSTGDTDDSPRVVGG